MARLAYQLARGWRPDQDYASAIFAAAAWSAIGMWGTRCPGASDAWGAGRCCLGYSRGRAWSLSRWRPPRPCPPGRRPFHLAGRLAGQRHSRRRAALGLRLDRGDGHRV